MIPARDNPIWMILAAVIFAAGVIAVEVLHAKHVDTDEFHRVIWLIALGAVVAAGKGAVNKWGK